MQLATRFGHALIWLGAVCDAPLLIVAGAYLCHASRVSIQPSLTPVFIAIDEDGELHFISPSDWAIEQASKNEI